MLNVSEVKKTKAGKVTIGYQLVLAGLATEGRCSASSQEGDREVGVVAGGWQGIPEVCFISFYTVCDIKACFSMGLTSPRFSFMFESLFVNSNN